MANIENKGKEISISSLKFDFSKDIQNMLQVYYCNCKGDRRRLFKLYSYTSVEFNKVVKKLERKNVMDSEISALKASYNEYCEYYNKKEVNKVKENDVNIYDASIVTDLYESGYSIEEYCFYNGGLINGLADSVSSILNSHNESNEKTKDNCMKIFFDISNRSNENLYLNMFDIVYSVVEDLEFDYLDYRLKTNLRLIDFYNLMIASGRFTLNEIETFRYFKTYNINSDSRSVTSDISIENYLNSLTYIDGEIIPLDIKKEVVEIFENKKIKMDSSLLGRAERKLFKDRLLDEYKVKMR